MMVITVCEPFASALILGGKDIENRRRRFGITGPQLIHAGKSLDWFKGSDWLHARWPECPANPVAAMEKFKGNLGKVIGVLWFHGDRAFELAPGAAHPNRWATGPWCHPTSCAFPLAEPIPAAGKQGLWSIPNTQLPPDVHALADLIREQVESQARASAASAGGARRGAGSRRR